MSGVQTRRSILTVGALSLCGLLTAGPAFAAKDPCLHSSSNWAGVTLPGDYTSISAKWHVPTVDCHQTAEGGTTDNWIGFGSGDDWKDPLNQIGTSGECHNGKADYWAWWEQYPASPYNFSNTVKPGDLMAATISRRAGSQSYRLKLENKTRNWSRKLYLAGPSTGTQVEVITELHSPAAVTSTAQYDEVKVDGQPLLNYQDKLQLDNGKKGGVCVDTSTTSPTTLVTALRKI